METIKLNTHVEKLVQRIGSFVILSMCLLPANQALTASPLIVAHRGASHDVPENMLPAFILAWEQGADAIETDVHLTRDGEIVCIHDDTTEDVAEQNLVIAQSTLHELQQLDVGRWFGRRWKGATIPTLAEVLQTVPDGKSIFIEIKCGPEILPPLVEVLRQSHLTPGQVVIISFDPQVIFAVKQALPVLKAFLCKFHLNRGPHFS